MASPAESKIIGATCYLCSSDEVSARALVVPEGGMLAGPAESKIIGVIITCCPSGSAEVSATAVVVLEGGMFEEPAESDVIGVTCSICCTDIPPSTTTTAVALKSDSGRKLVFDNFDFRQEVHYMTQDHQNVDVHWVTHMAVENRVSGNNLLSTRPVCQINELENGQCLPGRREHHLQRENYITLTEKAITEIPCLSFLKGAVTQHIPHPYSKEMSQTSHVVSATKFLFQLEIQEQTLIFLSVIIYQSIAAIKMHIN